MISIERFGFDKVYRVPVVKDFLNKKVFSRPNGSSFLYDWASLFLLGGNWVFVVSLTFLALRVCGMFC